MQAVISKLASTWRKPFSKQKTKLYMAQMITYDI